MRVPETIIFYEYEIRKKSVFALRDRENLASPSYVEGFLRSIELDKEERECLVCIILDSKNKIKGFQRISTGTIEMAIVHPRELFRPAIMNGGSAILMCHNHPSGDPNPSMNDIHLTSMVKDAGKILDIRLLDHIIVGEIGYFSFREKNIL